MSDKKEISREALELEKKNQESLARQVASQIDSLSRRYQQHLGAISAVTQLMDAYFPDEKSKEKSASESV